MEGLVEEGKEVLNDGGKGAVIDAGLIGAAQRVEHFEMAAYGTARALAEALLQTKVASLLQQTLDEKGEPCNSGLRMALVRIGACGELVGSVPRTRLCLIIGCA
jgi:ferritin-like metal-binding protein YciE